MDIDWGNVLAMMEERGGGAALRDAGTEGQRDGGVDETAAVQPKPVQAQPTQNQGIGALMGVPPAAAPEVDQAQLTPEDRAWLDAKARETLGHITPQDEINRQESQRAKDMLQAGLELPVGFASGFMTGGLVNPMEAKTGGQPEFPVGGVGDPNRWLREVGTQAGFVLGPGKVLGALAPPLKGLASIPARILPWAGFGAVQGAVRGIQQPGATADSVAESAAVGAGVQGLFGGVLDVGALGLGRLLRPAPGQSIREAAAEVLGVPRAATPAEVRTAYYGLARQYHPDINPDPAATPIMAKINDAFAVLMNPETRPAAGRLYSAPGAMFDPDAWRAAAAAAKVPAEKIALVLSHVEGGTDLAKAMIAAGLGPELRQALTPAATPTAEPRIPNAASLGQTPSTMGRGLQWRATAGREGVLQPRTDARTLPGEPVAPAASDPLAGLSEELKALHNSPVRRLGIDVASDSQAERYFEGLRRLAAKRNRQDILHFIDEAERAFWHGDYADAVAASEGALGYLHMDERAEVNAALEQMERLKNVGTELGLPPESPTPQAAQPEKPKQSMAEFKALQNLQDQARAAIKAAGWEILEEYGDMGTNNNTIFVIDKGGKDLNVRVSDEDHPKTIRKTYLTPDVELDARKSLQENAEVLNAAFAAQGASVAAAESALAGKAAENAPAMGRGLLWRATAGREGVPVPRTDARTTASDAGTQGLRDAGGDLARPRSWASIRQAISAVRSRAEPFRDDPPVRAALDELQTVAGSVGTRDRPRAERALAALKRLLNAPERVDRVNASMRNRQERQQIADEREFAREQAEAELVSEFWRARRSNARQGPVEQEAWADEIETALRSAGVEPYRHRADTGTIYLLANGVKIRISDHGLPLEVRRGRVVERGGWRVERGDWRQGIEEESSEPPDVNLDPYTRITPNEAIDAALAGHEALNKEKAPSIPASKAPLGDLNAGRMIRGSEPPSGKEEAGQTLPPAGPARQAQSPTPWQAAHRERVRAAEEKGAPAAEFLRTLSQDEQDEAAAIATDLRVRLGERGLDVIDIDSTSLMERMGWLYFKAGAIKFSAWWHRMAEAVGKGIKRYLWKVWAKVQQFHRDQVGGMGERPKRATEQTYREFAEANFGGPVKGMPKATMARLKKQHHQIVQAHLEGGGTVERKVLTGHADLQERYPEGATVPMETRIQGGKGGQRMIVYSKRPPTAEEAAAAAESASPLPDALHRVEAVKVLEEARGSTPAAAVEAPPSKPPDFAAEAATPGGPAKPFATNRQGEARRPSDTFGGKPPTKPPAPPAAVPAGEEPPVPGSRIPVPGRAVYVRQGDVGLGGEGAIYQIDAPGHFTDGMEVSEAEIPAGMEKVGGPEKATSRKPQAASQEGEKPAARGLPLEAAVGRAYYVRQGDVDPVGKQGSLWRIEAPGHEQHGRVVPEAEVPEGFKKVGGPAARKGPPGEPAAGPPAEAAPNAASDLSPDEAAVMQHVTGEPIDVDTLTEKSGLPAHKVSGALTMLQLKHRIERLAGGMIIKSKQTPGMPGETGAEKPQWPLEGQRVRRFLEDVNHFRLTHTAKRMGIYEKADVQAALWRLGIRLRHLADAEARGRELVPEPERIWTPLIDWLRGAKIPAWKGKDYSTEIAEAVEGRPALKKFFDFKAPKPGDKYVTGSLDGTLEEAKADPESGLKGDTASDLLDQMVREADAMEAAGGKKSLPELLDRGDEKARAMAESIREAMADADESTRAAIDTMMPYLTSRRTGISEVELREAVGKVEAQVAEAEAQATEAKAQVAATYAAKEKIIVLLDQFMTRRINEETLRKKVIDIANAVLPPEKRYKVLTGNLAKPMTEKRVAAILERIDEVRREARRGGMVEEADKVLVKARKALPEMSPEYQPLLAEILDQVQRKGLTRGTAGDLLRRRKYLDMHPEIEELMPERLRKELDRLGQKPLTEMSPEELRIFTDTVGRLIKQDKDARVVRIGQRDEERATVRAEGTAAFKYAADDRSLAAQPGREPDIEGKIFGIDFPPYRWLKHFMRRAANPKTQVKAWTYDESPLLTQVLVKDVEEAARVEAFEMGELSDAALAAVKALPGVGEGKVSGKHLESLTRAFERRPVFGRTRDFHQVVEEVKVPGGPTLRLTVGQQVALLLHLRDPYVVEELAKRAGEDMRGGINLRPSWNPSEIIATITIGDVPDIRAALEPRVGKSVDILGAYYNGPFRDRLFAVQFERDGYRVPTQDHYGGPIRWERELTMAATPMEQRDALLPEYVDATHQGYFKERKGGRRDLLIGDGIEIFLSHTTSGAQVIARATVLDSINQIIGDGGFREALLKYQGRSAVTALDEYLKSMMIKRRPRTGPETGIMQALTQGSQIAQLGINPWTWVRQLPATILFPTSDAIGLKPWVQALAEFAAHPSKALAATRRMIEHSAWARKRYRMQGGHSLVNQALEGGGVGPRALRDQVMQPISWVDQGASTPAWRAAEIIVEADHPDLLTSDQPELWDAVDRIFVEAMNDTQQSSDPHVKSSFAREAAEQAWMKLFLAYQSQPTSDLNNLARKQIALRIAVKGGDPVKIARAKKNLYATWAAVITAGVVAGVIIQAVQRFIRSGGKDKPSAESLAISTLNNVTGNLPFLREPLGAMQEAIISGRVRQGAGQTPLLSQLANFYDTAAHVGQAINAAEKGRPLSPALGKGLEHLFFGTAGIVGIPTAPYREARGIYRFAAGGGTKAGTGNPGTGTARAVAGRERGTGRTAAAGKRQVNGLSKAGNFGRHGSAGRAARPKTIRDWWKAKKVKAGTRNRAGHGTAAGRARAGHGTAAGRARERGTGKTKKQTFAEWWREKQATSRERRAASETLQA